MTIEDRAVVIVRFPGGFKLTGVYKFVAIFESEVLAYKASDPYILLFSDTRREVLVRFFLFFSSH